MENKVNIISIPHDKKINLVISGSFYQRINKLLIEFSESKGKEGLLQAMGKIKNNSTITDDFSYNLETLIILARDVEDEFKKANYTVTTEIDLDLSETSPNNITHTES